MYRCVKANDSQDVIAIGWDEGQGGHAYHDIGVWQQFTFTVIPQPTPELVAAAEAKKAAGGAMPFLLKVQDGQILLKEIVEI